MAENSSSDQEKDDPSFTELLNLLKDEPDFEKTMRELIQEVVTQRKAASQRALNWAKKADKTGAANTGKKNVLSPVRGTDGSVKPQKNRNRKTKLKARHYKEMANIMLKFPEEAFEKRNGFVKQLYVCANMQWKSYENWEKKIEDYLDNHRNGDKTAVLTSKREKLEITKLRELKESLDLKFEAVNSKIDVLHEMLTKLMKNDVKEGIENRDKETDQKPEIKKEPSS
ncbi:unnamed protein product, partial [Mesorhabditis belari]|uniref:Uncharacterized protein n=1 Tax=Mesorhabditis belari TaxID=2138241 RepID=A0AAF3EHS0_9BILA